tara:strand:+ start:125 stop:406 length:282 start_codon:yes stop_codon:yes gene_type:complete
MNKYRKENEMRDVLINSLRSYLTGNINKHLANVEVYMNSTTGIGEHSDIIETIEIELDKAASYHDKLEILTKYFIPTPVQQAEENKDAEKVSG